MIGSLRPWLPLSLVSIVRNWHPPSPLCEERHGGSTPGQKFPSADDRSFPRENSNWLPLWQIGIFSLLSRSRDIHRCVPCSTISLLHYCIELSVGCSVVFQAFKKKGENIPENWRGLEGRQIVTVRGLLSFEFRMSSRVQVPGFLEPRSTTCSSDRAAAAQK